MSEQLSQLNGLNPDEVSTATARYRARMLDLGLCYLVVLLIFPPWSPLQRSSLGLHFSIGAAMLLWLPIEILLMWIWGTTPGKLLLGIRVETESGGKLGLLRSFGRSVLVWLWGQAAGIPFMTYLAAASASRRLSREGSTMWDQFSACRVYQLPVTRAGLVAYWVVMVLLVGMGCGLSQRPTPIRWWDVREQHSSVRLPYAEGDRHTELSKMDLPGGAKLYMSWVSPPHKVSQIFVFSWITPSAEDATKDAEQLLNDFASRSGSSWLPASKRFGMYKNYPMLELVDPGPFGQSRRLIRTPTHVYSLRAPTASTARQAFFESLAIIE